MKVEGSVALVTGANRGLGAAFCRALLDRGAAKVYAGVRDVGSIVDAGVVPRAARRDLRGGHRLGGRALR